LTRAGLEPLAVIWPGPRAGASPPQFWLPIESRAATAHLLAARPGRGSRDALLRRAWRLAAQTGALAPLGLVARRRDSSSTAGRGDELGALVDGVPPDAWLLLTGGHRSINKVVGLVFGAVSPSPEFVVKFARVPEAEASVAHEASVLRTIGQEHPEVPGVPRVLATGRRVGRAALAQTALAGTPLISSLTFETFPRLAEQVTDWLVSLATRSEPRPTAIWRDRLVDEAVRVFERQFGGVVGDELLGRIRQRLAGLGPLPLVVEHRDCSPWNILLSESDAPVLLDWESAEPSGLPVLDLVYFLSNAAFVLEGALDSGRTPESYRTLLAPGTRNGRVAEACLSRYCRSLGLERANIPALRLLTWIVHCRSDFRHLELEPGNAPAPATLRRSPFLGLVEEELRSEAA
jgi:aminoglycoside phosphotransferase (APT) family kinase protein